MGFRAARVEVSGALTMAMSNGMSLQEKRASINGFRESVQVYGLDGGSWCAVGRRMPACLRG